jgi:hypothetical protein
MWQPLTSAMEVRLPRLRVRSVGRDVQAIRRSLASIVRAPGPVNVRETAGFCIYCSDPTLLTRVRPTGLVRGYGS